VIKGIIPITISLSHEEIFYCLSLRDEKNPMPENSINNKILISSGESNPQKIIGALKRQSGTPTV
jgi:hypothetical protein